MLGRETVCACKCRRSRNLAHISNAGEDAAPSGTDDKYLTLWKHDPFVVRFLHQLRLASSLHDTSR
jgi:hypothetical protein